MDIEIAEQLEGMGGVGFRQLTQLHEKQKELRRLVVAAARFTKMGKRVETKKTFANKRDCCKMLKTATLWEGRNFAVIPNGTDDYIDETRINLYEMDQFR